MIHRVWGGIKDAALEINNILYDEDDDATMEMEDASETSCRGLADLRRFDQPSLARSVPSHAERESSTLRRITSAQHISNQMKLSERAPDTEGGDETGDTLLRPIVQTVSPPLRKSASASVISRSTITPTQRDTGRDTQGFISLGCLRRKLQSIAEQWHRLTKTSVHVLVGVEASGVHTAGGLTAWKVAIPDWRAAAIAAVTMLEATMHHMPSAQNEASTSIPSLRSELQQERIRRLSVEGQLAHWVQKASVHEVECGSLRQQILDLKARTEAVGLNHQEGDVAAPGPPYQTPARTAELAERYASLKQQYELLKETCRELTHSCIGRDMETEASIWSSREDTLRETHACLRDLRGLQKIFATHREQEMQLQQREVNTKSVALERDVAVSELLETRQAVGKLNAAIEEMQSQFEERQRSMESAVATAKVSEQSAVVRLAEMADAHEEVKKLREKVVTLECLTETGSEQRRQLETDNEMLSASLEKLLSRIHTSSDAEMGRHYDRRRFTEALSAVVQANNNEPLKPKVAVEWIADHLQLSPTDRIRMGLTSDAPTRDTPVTLGKSLSEKFVDFLEKETGP